MSGKLAYHLSHRVEAIESEAGRLSLDPTVAVLVAPAPIRRSPLSCKCQEIALIVNF